MVRFRMIGIGLESLLKITLRIFELGHVNRNAAQLRERVGIIRLALQRLPIGQQSRL